jgi:hypothetical protein
MDNTARDRLHTAAQLARILGVPAKRIRLAIRAGALPAFRIGGWWRVRQRDAEACLDRQRYRPPQVASVQAESGRPRAIREIIAELRAEAERQAERHGALRGPIKRKQRRWSRALDEIERLEQESGS